MLKLLKRSAQAERQVARKAAKESKNEFKGNLVRFRQAATEASKEMRVNKKASRQASKDAWELGPLAPKRNLGIDNYDALQGGIRVDWTNMGTYKPKAEVVERRCAWAGGSKQLCIAPKDRVVILDGPDKGKIDKIKDINLDAGYVTLETCNQAITNAALSSVHSTSMPLPVSSVRLVFPITDPDTGVTRDVVFKELKPVPPKMDSPNMNLDRWTYGKKFDRLVPSLNQVIPWPETEVPDLKIKAADTPRDLVEHRSFHWSLLTPPMPHSVLDELRNKYGKYRTRHEQWYIQKKEAEEAAKDKRLQVLETMKTPLEEYHETKKAAKAAMPEPELSEDMLAKLGEIIAQKKAAALERAGVTEVSSSTTNTTTTDATAPQ